MSYQNFRARKAKGLVSLKARTVTHTVTDGGKENEKEETTFFLESKRFNESDGSELPRPEIFEIDIEALKKERERLQGFIEDIDEILATIEDQEE